MAIIQYSILLIVITYIHENLELATMRSGLGLFEVNSG